MMKENVKLLQTSFLFRDGPLPNGSFNVTALVQQIKNTKMRKMAT